MKKYCLSIVLLIIAVSVGAQKTIVNDRNAEIRTVNGNFENIEISGGIDLYLSQYNSTSIAVSAAADQYKEHIKTIVENNTLKIYYDGPKQWSSGNKQLKVYVSFNNLARLKASGGCDIVVAGKIEVNSLQVLLSGACNFKGAVKIANLSMELTGASDIRISGTANEVSIQTSGASDVKGYDLVTEICNAKASGASDINITVNKELNASASGASDIFYRGNAELKGNSSNGASSVVKKG